MLLLSFVIKAFLLYFFGNTLQRCSIHMIVFKRVVCVVIFKEIKASTPLNFFSESRILEQVSLGSLHILMCVCMCLRRVL
jgi:hypothetical protein